MDHLPTETAHLPRTFDRFPVNFPVHFRHRSGKTIEGLAKNVSQGGMYLETSKPLRGGEKSFFRLQLRPNSMQFHLEGEVVWTDKNKMGIRFLVDPRQNKKTLEDLVLALRGISASTFSTEL